MMRAVKGNQVDRGDGNADGAGDDALSRVVTHGTVVTLGTVVTHGT